MSIRPLVKLCIATAFCAGSHPALADQTLTADEVKSLFIGKTFEGYNEIKGITYKVYTNADGTMIHQNSKRTKTFKWEVDDEGRHCAHFKKGPLCGHIVSMGDGIYHKVNDGKHTNTLKNFVDGNRL